MPKSVLRSRVLLLRYHSIPDREAKMRQLPQFLGSLTMSLLLSGAIAAGCGRADRGSTGTRASTPPVTPTSATLEEGLSEVEILVDRGNRLVATDKGAAIELLTEAIRKDPSHQRARSVRGLLLAELNRDDEAFEDAEYLREHRSLLAGTIATVLRLKSAQYVKDGNQLLAAEDANSALAKFETAIRFHTEGAAGYAGRGRVRVRQGQLTDAESDFTRALQLDAESWAAFVGRGELRIAQGDHARALEDLNRAIQLAPNESGSYRIRSKAFALKGDSTAAEQDLRTADRIDSER
jgi:tetratricopeptide (TPR) repeat protein